MGGLLMWQDWALASMLPPGAAGVLHDLALLAVLPAAEGPSLTKRLAGAATRRRVWMLAAPWITCAGMGASTMVGVGRGDHESSQQFALPPQLGPAPCLS